jgi:hypothetical protein
MQETEVIMERLVIRKGFWLAVLMVLIVAGWAAVKPVQAYLGNTGVPVRCIRATPLSPGFRNYLPCVPANGPEFTDSNQRVPDGYYFLVTDITIIPDGGTDVEAITDVYVHSSHGESERVTSIRLRNVTTASYGISYRVPYLVLPAGHRLELVNDAVSQKGVSARISGILVTNVNFLPMVATGD